MSQKSLQLHVATIEIHLLGFGKIEVWNVKENLWSWIV